MVRNPPLPEDRHPILLAFGAAVRQHRKNKGLSQEAFADACGIDRSYMGGVERGERNIALINVEKIMVALELQPSEFFKSLDKPAKAQDPT
jgi:transcriptional regulator with XRE-family HTH domain